MLVQIVRQYSVFLPNKPGSLSDFTKLFLSENINIIGIASEIRDDSGVIRVCIEEDKRIGYVLTKAGFTTVETTMLSIDLPNRPGALHRLSQFLAEAGINITTVYGTAMGKESSRMLLATSDTQKAQQILISYTDNAQPV